MIEVKDVSKVFGGFNAINNISFSVKQGEVVGLLGPNGAGKTTTMRMLTGYYKVTNGTIHINNEPISFYNNDFKKLIGYLPEAASLYEDMIVCDFLKFVGKARGLDEIQLKEGIDKSVTSTSLQNYYYRPISHLSKGYRQRVGLASTLIHDPQILILDEPTSGLDPNQIKEIQSLIQNLSKSKTIILSTHILSEVEETCQRAILIKEGNVILDKTLKEVSQLDINQAYIIVALKNAQNSLPVFKAKFPNVDIEELSKTNDTITLKIREVNSTMNEDIFKLASDNQYIITELKKEESSLNDIFQALTTS